MWALPLHAVSFSRLMACGMQAGWDMTIDRLIARYDGRGRVRRVG
jgi:hypothetical protein